MAEKITHRTFLNDRAHGGRAYVRCEVTSEKPDFEVPTKLGVSAEFSVADCSRETTLDFNLSSWHETETKREHIAHLRRKAKKLRKAAVWFEKALNRELDKVEASLSVEPPKVSRAEMLKELIGTPTTQPTISGSLLETDTTVSSGAEVPS